ncbi:hypothetical protein THICB1_150079 [Thiomonas arsenitoxydans]|uniref:Uncharacterized protein n=1 Tax=Thiomonas arsenitoxydans (strain DSM 22701 / CIP 110005 / 3As) TaxID=426114 RepID=A0ABP1Z4L8_THIA3|nr:hypothetical protein ACO7_130030 [Thiomonas arsenitoxydans]CQR29113.1 hypothetical protein ACO3_150011 [Thiomonas arsenitoxydans]CQR30625.1 hypothetical protein THICB1_150079 [Thiomonas arsenitoxydans]CQR35546.1 hypothetical protein THICB6_230034 [Thiomonas arsenitoxydans]
MPTLPPQKKPQQLGPNKTDLFDTDLFAPYRNTISATFLTLLHVAIAAHGVDPERHPRVNPEQCKESNKGRNAAFCTAKSYRGV